MRAALAGEALLMARLWCQTLDPGLKVSRLRFQFADPAQLEGTERVYCQDRTEALPVAGIGTRPHRTCSFLRASMVDPAVSIHLG